MYLMMCVRLVATFLVFIKKYITEVFEIKGKNLKEHYNDKSI